MDLVTFSDVVTLKTCVLKTKIYLKTKLSANIFMDGILLSINIYSESEKMCQKSIDKKYLRSITLL